MTTEQENIQNTPESKELDKRRDRLQRSLQIAGGIAIASVGGILAGTVGTIQEVNPDVNVPLTIGSMFALAVSWAYIGVQGEEYDKLTEEETE